MTNAQEMGQKVQEQTLESVRKAQDAVVEAVSAWTETASKAPTVDDINKQLPTVADLIDSNFDFAQRILTNQREFAHRIIAATTPKTESPKAKAPKVEAPKVEAPKVEAPKVEAPKPAAAAKTVETPAAPKKTTPAKTVTAAKKTTAARQSGTATAK